MQKEEVPKRPDSRKVGELKKWLSQFPDDWDVWGYEGEVVGIVVGEFDEEKGYRLSDYCFHNGKKDIGHAWLTYPQKCIKVKGKLVPYILTDLVEDENLDDPTCERCGRRMGKREYKALQGMCIYCHRELTSEQHKEEGKI